MLLLFETAAGYALFKVLDSGKVEKGKDLFSDFRDLDHAKKQVKLKKFCKFENTAEATEATSALLDSKLSKGLKKFLSKNVSDGETLALQDSKLGNIVKEKLNIECVANSAVMELTRAVRSQIDSLIASSSDSGKFSLGPMRVGLGHSLSRYRLKFSSDKVDTMIIQAIALLDDLDKELNTYAMRVREWYGWHFPELGKIIADNIQYCKVVKLMGPKEKVAECDFSECGVAEEVEEQLKAQAPLSMGTEISEEDIEHITCLCDQVVDLADYRTQLFDYLKSRMTSVAPNLTVMVGELVGARLIAHAGSLLSLAKHPASTVQILGAEKALFRALKTKHETPKYGLIYHASLVGQSAPKHKGKISRVLAAKAALAVRVDALGDGGAEDNAIGLESRAKVEARLRQLEGKQVSASPFGSAKVASEPVTPSVGKVTTFSTAEDVTMTNGDGEETPKSSSKKDKKKKDKKDKKDKKRRREEEAEEAEGGSSSAKKEKKKKKKKDK